MDLVDEQHVAVFEIGEQRGKVAGLGDDRARGRAEVDAELARHDLRQRRLAEAGRPDEQHMVERLAAPLGRLDEHFEIGAHRRLPDEFVERLRPQRHVGILAALFRGDEAGRRGSCRGVPCRQPIWRPVRSNVTVRAQPALARIQSDQTRRQSRHSRLLYTDQAVRDALRWLLELQLLCSQASRASTADSLRTRIARYGPRSTQTSLDQHDSADERRARRTTASSANAVRPCVLLRIVVDEMANAGRSYRGRSLASPVRAIRAGSRSTSSRDAVATASSISSTVARARYGGSAENARPDPQGLRLMATYPPSPFR